jgi:hypothetical protein
MPTILDHSIEDTFMRSIVLLSAAFALGACAETNPSAASETPAQDPETTISEPMSELETEPQLAGFEAIWPRNLTSFRLAIHFATLPKHWHFSALNPVWL